MFGVAKRGKRAQITLFVIIGILIIGAVATLFIFRSNIFTPAVSAEEAQKIVSAQVQPVREHIEGCMNAISMKTLNTLGRQGGSIFPKADRISFPNSVMADSPAMPYALFESKNRGYINLFPSINEMKEEFVQFMENNPEFEECIDGFSSFNGVVNVKKTADMKIDAANLDFGENSGSVVIPFTYPVDISKGNAKVTLKDYKITIPINLAKIHEFATMVINAEAKGESVTKILSDQAILQEQQLRENARSDTITLQHTAYDLYDTEENGVSYNNKNTFYKMEYKNQGLDEPYYFSFLVGEQ